MIEERLTPLVCERFLREEKYRQGHIRIINALPGRRILGLHLPEMKQVAKELVRQADAREVLHAFGQEHQTDRFGLAYEETLVWGLTINALKCTPAERLDLLRRYIPVLDNWAVCDSFCCNAKWALKLPPQDLWAFLIPYYHSHREFEVRFAIVMSMCYLLKEEWLSPVFEELQRIDLSAIHSEYTQLPSPYYVRMGMAWLLATALAKYPDETRSFVNASSLAEDVKRLYARKARESFRTRNVPAF
ncbi:MAG: DNA alkylation repair protein [Bacteroidaceae bacterium]|nr:DNA alkylation repair protein [Bacteroidaceae bacterium]